MKPVLVVVKDTEGGGGTLSDALQLRLNLSSSGKKRQK